MDLKNVAVTVGDQLRKRRRVEPSWQGRDNESGGRDEPSQNSDPSTVSQQVFSAQSKSSCNSVIGTSFSFASENSRRTSAATASDRRSPTLFKSAIGAMRRAMPHRLQCRSAFQSILLSIGRAIAPFHSSSAPSATTPSSCFSLATTASDTAEVHCRCHTYTR